MHLYFGDWKFILVKMLSMFYSYNSSVHYRYSSDELSLNRLSLSYQFFHICANNKDTYLKTWSLRHPVDSSLSPRLLCRSIGQHIWCNLRSLVGYAIALVVLSDGFPGGDVYWFFALSSLTYRVWSSHTGLLLCLKGIWMRIYKWLLFSK